jgi:hypothetical protein
MLSQHIALDPDTCARLAELGREQSPQVNLGGLGWPQVGSLGQARALFYAGVDHKMGQQVGQVRPACRKSPWT